MVAKEEGSADQQCEPEVDGLGGHGTRAGTGPIEGMARPGWLVRGRSLDKLGMTDNKLGMTEAKTTTCGGGPVKWIPQDLETRSASQRVLIRRRMPAVRVPVRNPRCTAAVVWYFGFLSDLGISSFLPFSGGL